MKVKNMNNGDNQNATSVTINRLGHLGDGVGKLSDDASSANIYVPFSLEGEVVLADCSDTPAEFISVEKAAPNRIDAICPHFTQCGGCQMQHLAQDDYASWKMNILQSALSEFNIKTTPEPLVHVALHSRRRTVFSAMRVDGQIELGYLKRQSHQLIAISQCPLLDEKIIEALPKLHEIAELATPHKGALKLQVIACENGIDVTLSNVENMGNKLRRGLTLALEDCSIIRLSNDDEIVLEKTKPFVIASGHNIYIQPGAFCQASVEAEELMADLIKKHLGKSKHVVDLFSGSGSFSFAASNFTKTHAIEVSDGAINALNTSRGQTTGIKPLTAEVRDLYRRPLHPHELKAYDGAIFDPPRGGAKSQMDAINNSKIEKVVAISCNPNTLAEDLSILIKGGFKVTHIQPIDQFLFSPHLEVVALLERKVVQKRKPIFG